MSKEDIRITIAPQHEANLALARFAKSLPEVFGREGEALHVARNVVKAIDAEGVGRVVVKRYRGLWWPLRIVYSFLRSPKCRRAFSHTAELRRRGIEAAEELACVEIWRGGLFHHGYFVSRQAVGTRLDTLLVSLNEQGKKDECQAVCDAFAAAVVHMHRHGVLFRDLNGGNVICRQDAAAWHFCLIDTNRARFFDPQHELTVGECTDDLTLMNPKTGCVEMFIASYLRQRDCYSDAMLQRILTLQQRRSRRLKNLFKRKKKQ